MKKSALLVAALLFSPLISSAQVRYGVTAGVQLVSQKYTLGGLTLKTSNQLSYMGGLLADVKVSEKISIRPQVLYSVKGSAINLGSLSGGLTSGSVSTVFTYVEVPVQLTYSLEAGPGSVVLGAGPYLAYALSGKSTATNSGKKESQTIDFSTKDGDARRLDYGLRLSVGYELPSGVMVSGYYSPGLANIANGASSSVKNTAFGLSLGFLFGGK
ncbi:porin family protein [Spirosoma aerophilum]